MGIRLEELLEELHPTKNSIVPEQLKPHSKKIFWWQCKEGHEWEAIVSNRFSGGSGCPYCSNKKVLPGYNDLITRYPQAKEYWDYEKNSIQPTELSPGSKREVWWTCDSNHSYKAPVSTRIHKGRVTKCRYCVKQAVDTGLNDLATCSPLLVAEWHPTKNAPLQPTQVLATTQKQIWWQCEEGHEWKQSPYSRNKTKRQGCPVCLTEFLKNVAPHLEREWHPTKNVLDFKSLSRGSSRKVWWQCVKGHEWEATPASRAGGASKPGTNCPVCAGNKVDTNLTSLKAKHPDLAQQFHSEKNEVSAEEVPASSGKKFWWQGDCGHEWQAKPCDRVHYLTGCPQCYRETRVSQAERILYQHLVSSAKTSVYNGVKTVISPHELDIYIPERKLAVEFNGLYWHSESQGRDKWYHHKKWAACQSKGIQLIQIWEDDWGRNPELVKRMLNHKIGMTTEKTAARKTKPVILSQVDTNNFLEANHIQGAVDGSIRAGLVDATGSIIAAMILKVEPNSDGKVLNLLRFATSVSVPGGFTKLLTSVLRTNPSVTSIVTFSDNTVSDGGLYEKNGFVAVKQLPPDYMYVVGKQRVHKFNYRLSRFKKDPTLIYEEGLSERELADLNGLDRVWDAGKTKWELTV